MDFSHTDLDALGRQAYAHIQAADKAKGKSEQHEKAAGLYLIEAKARVEKVKGLTWVQYLVTNCPVGKSRSYELIAIADGRKTVEEVRSGTAERMAEKRQRDAERPSRDGQSSSKTEQKQSRTPVDEARDEADDHHNAMLKRVIAMVKKLDDNQLTTLELKLREITQ